MTKVGAINKKFSISFPSAYSHLGAAAFFRSELEDFRVEEKLGFSLSGQGEHLYLQIEKRDMKKYLRTTLEVNNTTTKLRKAFPSTLQKYIPPEPTRAPRQAKLPINEPDAVELPGNLKLRMTENLLDN